MTRLNARRSQTGAARFLLSAAGQAARGTLGFLAVRRYRRSMTRRVTLHGIKACDTMKKARDWLDGRGVTYNFHDYKTAGIDRATLQGWAGKVGWEVLLNRAGTTFRNLPDADKTGLTEARAIDLMLAQPSMIKRPVLDVDGELLVGFKPELYAAVLP